MWCELSEVTCAAAATSPPAAAPAAEPRQGISLPQVAPELSLRMNSFAALGDSDDEEVVVEKKTKPKVEKTEAKDTKKKEESKQKVHCSS